MWIRITMELPVQARYRPPLHSIFWATAWPNEEYMKSELRTSLNADYNLEMGFGHAGAIDQFIESVPLKVWRAPIFFGSWIEERKEEVKAKKRKRLKDYDEQEILDDTQLVSKIEKYFFGEIIDDGIHGLTPNFAGRLKVRYRNQEIGIFRHECEIMKANDIIDAVDIGDYTLIPDTVAEGQVNMMFDDTLKSLMEEGMWMGLTKEQAKLAAMGVDVTEEFILPPTGWYKFDGIEEYPNVEDKDEMEVVEV